MNYQVVLIFSTTECKKIGIKMAALTRKLRKSTSSPLIGVGKAIAVFTSGGDSQGIYVYTKKTTQKRQHVILKCS